MTKFRIYEVDPSGSNPEERIFLGVVRSSKPIDDAKMLIQSGWEKFIETQPDTSSEYIDYLVENFQCFEHGNDDTVDVEVGI